MSGYGAFAAFYDCLMSDVDYKARSTYLLSLFKRFCPDQKIKTVLDLACGSGNLLLEIMNCGIDVIGVDGSPEMLAEAEKKSEKAGKSPLLLCQDMRKLDLYGTVDGAVCALDSLNHICETKGLEEIFHRLFLFIEPGGLFIFDVNTPYKHRHILCDNAFVFEKSNFLCVWQNKLLSRKNEVDMQLDFFVKDGAYYQRFTDHVRERAYSEKTLRRLLCEAGFELLAVYDDMSVLPAKETSERLIFVAKRKRKED